MRWLILLVAACSSAPVVAKSQSTCDLDPRLTADECAAVRAMALPVELPPARGNAKGDDLDAAALGFAVFYDARFSKNESVRCATCHVPEHRFSDGKAKAMGLAEGTRHSPTLLNAARMRWIFWDGRADSLWSQPLFAFENPLEMDFTRLEIAHAIALRYKPDYERVFGPLPDLSGLPARGRPGDAAWDAMSDADRDAVDRVAANVGKALEAYVRKLAAGPSALERFLGGDKTAIDPAGLVAFVKNGCASCHSGPLLSDQGFHALGDSSDIGRAGAYATLAESPFTARGVYWDGPHQDVPTTGTPSDRGAFRTPSLRNITRSGPWGHDGRFATLDDAIAAHGPIAAADRAAIVTFLESLDGTYPLPPWNDWPMR